MNEALVEGIDRGQTTLFGMPGRLDDEDNPVRVIDAFVDELDLSGLGFDGVAREATGRPSYHPRAAEALHLRLPQSRSVEWRLEREAGRNVEVMWLTGQLVPDHKTIADFRKDSGLAIKKVCVQFIELCRQVGLLTKASVAIDGSSQSGEQPGRELHARESGAAPRTIGGERGALSCAARHG